MVEPHTVLEVADGVLDLGVAAVVGLQFEGLPLPVGDEAVIAVVGEGGQLRAGRGRFTLRTMSRTGAASGSLWKGSAGGLGHIGGAVHPVGYGRPVLLGYGLNDLAQAGVLADCDGEADLRLCGRPRPWRGCRSRCRHAS